MSGPPWVIVIHLPDDIPPIDALTRDFARLVPDGSKVTAFAADAAEAVIATAQIAGLRASGGDK